MTSFGGSLSVRLATLLRERGAARPASTAVAVAPVLRALAELTDRHGGRPPTHAELAAVTFRSPSTVRNHLNTLARHRLVKLPAPGTPRSVQLTERGRNIVRGDHHS